MAELKDNYKIGKRQPKTTKQQYELYVEFIEGNREMTIKKDSDKNIQHLWDRLTNLLNSVSGPQRSKEGWKKIFENWRNSVRHKKRKDIISINATGGGPELTNEKLNPLEQRAISAWGAVVIDGISEIEAGFNETRDETSVNEGATIAEPMIPDTNTQKNPRSLGTKRKQASDGDDILKKLITIESERSSEIGEGLRDIADSINNLAEAIYVLAGGPKNH